MSDQLDASFEYDAWSSAVAFLQLDQTAILADRVNSGASNYVIGINEAGTTWAAAIRLPAPGADHGAFVEDKRSSIPLLDRLAERLKHGIYVNERCTLRFAGNSRFVDAESTKEFLRSQSGKTFTIHSPASDFTKTIQGLEYLATHSSQQQTAPVDAVFSHARSYAGPFFLSRGAPASETVEDFPELAADVAQALARLHLTFPQVPTTSASAAYALLRSARSTLRQAAREWVPSPMSKDAKAFEAMMEKPEWGSIPQVAAQEALLRSATGRALLAKAADTIEPPVEDGFVHGDAHGRNFILVWFEYQASSPAGAMDRLLINEVFEHSRSDTFYYCRSGDSATISAEPLAGAVRVDRAAHFEVHPIDFDDASFSRRFPQVLDAVTFALSVEAITMAFGRQSLDAEHILDAYTSARNP